ncbi:hypothetical protein M011DRAFT_174794 [Sporormia fimetaria CBS 119925]|uniref:DUF1996 domain-containing protein n=1 Tax=Sporormia fimetaria CBS 119925 TaxID=1340428 RepID=A0A6A6VLA3_9PLEO|nr:hypothetical protein M011DRAFT_174794 [Sporormia fimetaria CBS 119925]
MLSTMHTLILALFASHASAQPPFNIPPMMRFQCSQLVIDRIDPLVNPGSVPSPHLHQIVGGNSFRPLMTHDLPASSTCTTCTFSEDFSNYWTAVLYFRARNGTFMRVPQVQEIALPGNGGITVYYIPSTDNSTAVTAFKPGFRMLVGDAASRDEGPARKVCHRCMPVEGDLSNLNCASPDTQSLPKSFCPGGIRSVVTFPTCWDGKNLDSPDHMSHVAYAEGARPYDVGPTGKCPESHPVVIPQVMYEVRWDVSCSVSRKPTRYMWLNDSYLTNAVDNPLQRSGPVARGWFAALRVQHWRQVGPLFSRPEGLQTQLTADRDGYSWHGDYVFGWKGDSLQRAMNARCTGDVCDVLEMQTTEKAVKCAVSRMVDEEIDGWLSALPGNVMVS